MSKTLTAAQIEAAKEAGFYWHPVRKGLVVRHSSGSWVSVDDMLARFVALLATQQPEPRASLTDDQRDKIERAEERLRGRGPEDAAAANGLLEVLTAHPVQPESRDEVTDEQIAAMFERVTGYSLDNGRAALNDADILGFARELLEAARTGASHE